MAVELMVLVIRNRMPCDGQLGSAVASLMSWIDLSVVACRSCRACLVTRPLLGGTAALGRTRVAVLDEAVDSTIAFGKLTPCCIWTGMLAGVYVLSWNSGLLIIERLKPAWIINEAAVACDLGVIEVPFRGLVAIARLMGSLNGVMLLVVASCRAASPLAFAIGPGRNRVAMFVGSFVIDTVVGLPDLPSCASLTGTLRADFRCRSPTRVGVEISRLGREPLGNLSARLLKFRAEFVVFGLAMERKKQVTLGVVSAIWIRDAKLSVATGIVGSILVIEPPVWQVASRVEMVRGVVANRFVHMAIVDVACASCLATFGAMNL